MTSANHQIEYSYSNACRLALSVFVSLEKCVKISREERNAVADRELRFLEAAKGNPFLWILAGLCVLI
jgi:hypothetical protein